jgi:very-short-patch-repair endonuclease
MPHTPLSPRHRANAKSMRKVMTDAELKLWNEIRAHQLMGLGFRRQFPIAGYIVDFACPKRKLVVEVDGSQHAEVNAATDDEVRTKRLQQDGWIILRFWNDDVIRDIDNVCQHIVIGAGLAGTSQIRAWAGHHGKAGGTVPPLSCRTFPPNWGGDRPPPQISPITSVARGALSARLPISLETGRKELTATLMRPL